MSVPKRYRSKHIIPGIVDYEDGNQKNTVLVKKEVLDKMNPSFVGKPVFNFIHKIIDAETAFNFTEEEKEKQAVGIVSDVGYDIESGYFIADLMIWDEDTQQNIDKKGFNVSCAYIPVAGEGGVYNNVPYDEEIIDGEYHHMAIVEDPRYNEAVIFENSKPGGKVAKFKLNFGKNKVLKNEAPPENDKKKEPEEKELSVNGDSIVKDEDGSEYSMNELMENMRQVKKNTEEEEVPTMNMEDTVDVDGEEYTVREMVDNMKAKKNAEPPTDTPLEDVVKENSLEEKKEGEKNFKIIQNAVIKDEVKARTPVTTRKSRLEAGRNRYGSPVENGGK